MKNKIVVMGLTLLLLMMLPLGVLAGENLISNGDFSQLDDSGLPVGWTYAAWNSEETVSTYWTETGGWKTFRKTTPGWNSRSR